MQGEVLGGGGEFWVVVGAPQHGEEAGILPGTVLCSGAELLPPCCQLSVPSY